MVQIEIGKELAIGSNYRLATPGWFVTAIAPSGQFIVIKGDEFYRFNSRQQQITINYSKMYVFDLETIKTRDAEDKRLLETTAIRDSIEKSLKNATDKNLLSQSITEIEEQLVKFKAIRDSITQ